MASFCEKLPACKTGWKGMCFDMSPCVNLYCMIRGNACVNVGTEELCTGVVEIEVYSPSNGLCDEKGISEVCKKRRSTRVCATNSTSVCAMDESLVGNVYVEEQFERKCTKDDGNNKWCITERNKTAKMDREKLCKLSQVQWQKCSVKEDTRKACIEENCLKGAISFLEKVQIINKFKSLENTYRFVRLIWLYYGFSLNAGFINNC